MFEPFKINRVLPPHELNARLPQPPPIAKRPIASDTFHEPAVSPNDHVFNHGADRITHHE
jgi:hypothetical protein